MPVNITARNVSLPKHFQEVVKKKARRLKKFFDKVDKIEVVFSQQKQTWRCEIDFHAAPFDCHISGENGNYGSAFDKALKTAERTIKNRKNRMIDRRRKIPTEVLEPAPEVEDDFEELEEMEEMTGS